ncbi:MAG TPA: hypothetical protein VIL97_02225, partial [Thermoanaerobaculia bacterium]
MSSEIFVSHAARPLLARVDTVVFDIDGVLVDVSASYPSVIAEATRFYLVEIAGLTGSDPITPDETKLFKRAGGFNDDWSIAKAAVRLCLMKSARSGQRDVAVLRSESPTLEELTSAIAAGGGGYEVARELTPCDIDEKL